MPSDYNGGTITAVFHWSCSGGTGTQNVVWGIQGTAYGDSDALDVAWGTGVTVSDTWLTDLDVHISAATAAVTLAGTPAAGEFAQFRVYRDVANDNLAVDAWLLGVRITFTRA
jgi:peptidoglycan hydrolase-like amidase